MIGKAALATLSMILAASRAPCQVRGPQEAFSRAKQLIEANFCDSVGSSRQGLERGIAELLKVIDAGSATKEAYKLLALAYNEMAAGCISSREGQKDLQARKDYRARMEAVYRKLVEMAPDDPEVLEDFAYSLPDGNEKIAAFRRVLAIDPKRGSTQYSLGLLLIRTGLFQEGIQNARDGFLRSEDPDRLDNCVSLIDVLNEHCTSKIDFAVRSDLYLQSVAIENFSQYEGYQETQQLAMRQFKKHFLDMLDRFKCRE